MLIRWCRSSNQHLVLLYEHLISLVHARCSFAETVMQGFVINVNNGSFTLFLFVVNPSNDGNEIMKCHLVGQLMRSVKAYRVGVVFIEQVKSMHQWVFIAK